MSWFMPSWRDEKAAITSTDSRWRKSPWASLHQGRQFFFGMDLVGSSQPFLNHRPQTHALAVDLTGLAPARKVRPRPPWRGAHRTTPGRLR